MKKHAYLKRVRSQILMQCVILIVSLMLSAAGFLFYVSHPGIGGGRMLFALMPVLSAAAIYGNFRVADSVRCMANTFDVMIERGGEILTEEGGFGENEQIDDQLIDEFRDMIREFLNLGSTQEIIRTQTDLVALQKQINPHFLYNTLDVIRSEAIIEDAKNSAAMIESLSRIFRYGISTKEDLVSLDVEIKNVRDYFFIQQCRFPDRFRLEFCEEEPVDCSMVWMPKLTLQPLVENAISHAFPDLMGEGIITITLEPVDDRIRVIVSDNGCGMEPDALHLIRKHIREDADGAYPRIREDTTGIALQNIHKRVRLFFGDSYGLNVFSMPGAGTDVVVELPYAGGR